jgi:hypothetical protein
MKAAILDDERNEVTLGAATSGFPAHQQHTDVVS